MRARIGVGIGLGGALGLAQQWAFAFALDSSLDCAAHLFGVLAALLVWAWCGCGCGCASLLWGWALTCGWWCVVCARVRLGAGVNL